MCAKRLFYVLVRPLVLTLCVACAIQSCALPGSGSASGNQPVFLGAAFGMTVGEVRKALVRNDAQLVTRSQYEKVTVKPLVFLIPASFVPDFPEDMEESWYMPTIRMWNSRAEAEFGFKDGRLRDISVYLGPTQRERMDVVEMVRSDLKARYTSADTSGALGILGEGEPSEEVPGAYTLNFRRADGAQASFWVNLTGSEEPILILHVWDGRARAAEARKTTVRQDEALGPKRQRR